MANRIRPFYHRSSVVYVCKEKGVIADILRVSRCVCVFCTNKWIVCIIVTLYSSESHWLQVTDVLTEVPQSIVEDGR